MGIIHTWTCNVGIGIDLVCAVWWLTIDFFLNGFQLKLEKKEILIGVGFFIGASLLFFSRKLGIQFGVLSFENLVFLTGAHLTIGMLRVSITTD